MMDWWLEWAQGPMFRFALAFMVLGLARHFVLTVAGIVDAVRKAGDRRIPVGRVLLDTLSWLFPVTKVRERLGYSLVSVIFHVCVTLVPLFLAGHIELWRRGIGIGWPALSAEAADVLTLAAITAAACIIVARLASRESRELSRTQDVLLPGLIAVPFVTGFMVSHPWANPFRFEATLFVHVMSANLIFVLVPLTKLSHMVLIPTTQTVAEVAWHFPAASGRDVSRALGKEGQAI